MAVMTEAEKQSMKLGVECYNSFYFFFRMFWSEMSGEKYVDAPHIKFICDELQHWAMKIIKREKVMKTICISVPPGSSKSTIVTIALPAWCWLRAPNLSTINISYAATLSQQHAQKARTITDSQKWKTLFDPIFDKIHGRPLKIEKQNQTEMLNNFKGNRYSTSVGGTLLGMHGDIFCVDDAISAEQVNSDVERSKANRWLDETKTSRKKNPSCYLDINISQRLHEEDSIGHILNKNLDIYYICLPAEISDKTAKSVSPTNALMLYSDGILDPNRRPKDVLNVIKEEMGSTGYSGQYLQVPFNLDEQDITPAMFNIVESIPDDIVWDVWIDGAYTEKTENDPSGIDVIAKHNNEIIIKESYDVRKKLPDLVAFIKELESTGVFDKDKSRIFIEPKASGYSLAQYIESDTDYNYVLLGEDDKSAKKLIQEGKHARHQMIKPKAESRRLKLLKGTWNDNFITQICGFPRAAHDEHVDNLGYAIHRYYMNESTFIEDYALERVRLNVPGSINMIIESFIEKRKIETSYKENDKGDIQLFYNPYHTHNYRYITTLALRNDDNRGDNTVITVFDRLNMNVSALYVSSTITADKAGLKALEMAHLYDKAKLVVINKKESIGAKNEESDLSHLAIQSIRSTNYNNIYYQLTHNSISYNKEREFGFLADQSGRREVYFELKRLVEKGKVSEIPLEAYQQMITLERKKESGDIDTKEGLDSNAILSYAVCLRVSELMYDDVKVKKKKSLRGF